MTAPTIRIASPSHDLSRLKRFYVDGLGLEVIGSLAGHEGFDGIMFGKPGAPYHFEFTKKHGEAPLASHPDRLIVIYLPDTNEWTAALERMKEAGFAPVVSENPYWDRAGRTFKDPDGGRVVLQNAAWPQR